MDFLYYMNVFMFLLSLFIYGYSSIGHGISSEGKALLDFLKTASNYDKDGILVPSMLGWNEYDPDPCRWTGIACSPDNRVLNVTISDIDLSGSSITSEFALSLPSLRVLILTSINITGGIPGELGECRELQVLNLSNNSLIGKIPAELGQLGKLEELHLDLNLLEGKIPATLGDCLFLRNLTLEINNITGSVPPELGRLKNLEILKVGGNLFLSGNLPPQLSACTSLKMLVFSYTSVSGNIPPELGNLNNLVGFYMYHANLSGIIPAELGNCTQLEELHIYTNRIGGRLPGELGKLRRLSSVLLGDNHLSGPVPSELGSLTSLKTLDLTGNQLSGSIPSSLGNMSSLLLLSLSDNKLSGSIPNALGNCTVLKELYLEDNWLSGTVPSEIFGLRYLERFKISSNSLVGQIPPALRDCRSLFRFIITNNYFSEMPWPEVAQLPNLTYLDISYNQISGRIDGRLSGSKSLQELNLNRNQISGELPPELGLLASLQVLKATQNRISGTIPSSIGNLRSLFELSLRGNLINGSIPDSLSNCNKLQSLDLSSNSLSGFIPASIGKMESLTISLNLSCNKLSGSLPEEIAGLVNLGTLDLSHNNLSGSLDVLGRLIQLVTVNISFNSFSGTLPNTHFFRALPPSDYQGDNNLHVPSSSNPHVSDNNLHIPSSSNPRVSSPANIITWKGMAFGGAGIIMSIVFFLLCAFSLRKRRLSRSYYKDTDSHGEGTSEWPWQMKLFQKVNFSLHDIVDRLADCNVIGQGYSGVVYKVEMPGGEVIAVKKLAAINKGRQYDRDMFWREIETLGSIRHINIVRLLGYCTNQNTRLLLYDFASNGSLDEVLHTKRRMLDWECRYNIMVGAAQGLAYLHHDCLPPILHRDIKPNNILIGPNFEPYLTDFGLAKFIHDNHYVSDTNVSGSLGYIAPEYGYALNITDKSDVFSFGVVMLELVTGRRPVNPNPEEEDESLHIVDWVNQAKNIVSVLDEWLREHEDDGMAEGEHRIKEMVEVVKMALRCCHWQPEKRPNMRQVVSVLTSMRHEQDPSNEELK